MATPTSDELLTKINDAIDTLQEAQMTVVNGTTTLGNAIHKDGEETLTGTKTFTASPIVPTLADSDNSQKAASTAFVKSVIVGKADATTVNTKLAAKADSSVMNTALASKADQNATSAALADKADKAQVAIDLATKADATTVNNELATKATKAELTQGLAGKLDLTGGILSGNIMITDIDPAIILKDTDIDLSQRPAKDTATTGICFSDNNNQKFAAIEIAHTGDNGRMHESMSTYRTVNGQQKKSALHVGIKEDGAPYTLLNYSPAADSNENQVATTKWTNDKLASKLDKSGGTMTGTLQFSNTDPLIEMTDTNLDTTQNPTARQDTVAIKLNDKTSNSTAIFGTQYFQAGTLRSVFGLQRTVNGALKHNKLYLDIKPDGEMNTQVEHPKADANGNQIATTKWVRDLIAAELAKLN